jgi:hypothetical protein
MDHQIILSAVNGANPLLKLREYSRITVRVKVIIIWKAIKGRLIVSVAIVHGRQALIDAMNLVPAVGAGPTNRLFLTVQHEAKDFIWVGYCNTATPGTVESKPVVAHDFLLIQGRI